MKQAGKRASVVEKERAGNFEELAERWFTAEVAHKSEGWQTGVRNWFKLDIYPALGKRDPRTIGEFHIRQMLDKIEQRGSPASANKVRAIVRHIFAYAKRKGEVSVNPTTEIEPVAHRDRKSHRALGVKEIGPFLKALDRDRGREGNKLAIRLLMLTFVRKDELRQAKWTEFDFDNKVWEIPAHRMKMSDPHRVYLSRQAIEQLDSLRELSHGSEYVLPHFSTLSRSIGQTTINNVIDRLDIQGARFVPHGFRATASTILNEKGFRPEVIERSLAHKERNKVRGIYNQAEYAQERAAMAQWWADYVDALEAGGNVIPMNFKTAA